MMSYIGFDLGATKMSAGLIIDSKIKKIVTEKTKAQGTQKEIIKQITNFLDQLFDASVQGIGIGAPGLVDERGVVYEAVNITAWKKVELKKILEKRFGVQVYVGNDANCFALGEKHFGKGKKYNNIAAVTLGTGMGAGLIISGKLYKGANGGAGEFGQIPYKNGIMENYSSGQFFECRCQMSGDEVFKQAKRGDKKVFRQSSRQAMAIFEEYGYHLGKALSMIVYAVNPEIIILGGSVSRAFRYFEKAMKKSLKESSYGRTYGGLKIAVSENPDIAILGAAAMCQR